MFENLTRDGEFEVIVENVKMSERINLWADEDSFEAAVSQATVSMMLYLMKHSSSREKSV